jgi:hypothetical protein
MKLGTIFTLNEYDEAYKYVSENGYTIEEIEPKGEERQFKIVEIPEPTKEEIAQARINELKSKLQETDYVVIKIAEGEATQEKYAEVLANRKAWRAEIKDLEK